MFNMAETVPSITALTEMASVFAMRRAVVSGSQQLVGVGKPQSACSGKRHTWEPESTTAPCTLTSNSPNNDGNVMRTLRRGWPLKEALATAMMGASKGAGSVSLELCLG